MQYQFQNTLGECLKRQNEFVDSGKIFEPEDIQHFLLKPVYNIFNKYKGYDELKADYYFTIDFKKTPINKQFLRMFLNNYDILKSEFVCEMWNFIPPYYIGCKIPFEKYKFTYNNKTYQYIPKKELRDDLNDIDRLMQKYDISIDFYKKYYNEDRQNFINKLTG